MQSICCDRAAKCIPSLDANTGTSTPIFEGKYDFYKRSLEDEPLLNVNPDKYYRIQRQSAINTILLSNPRIHIHMQPSARMVSFFFFLNLVKVRTCHSLIY